MSIVLRPEAQILLLGSRIHMTDTDVARTAKIIGDNQESIDWGYLVQQAFSQKVASLIARNFQRHDLYISRDFPLRAVLKLSYQSNRLRNLALYEEFAFLMRAFNSRNVVAVARKGLLLAQEVYQDIGVRQMSDLDLLIAEHDVDAVCEVLNEVGYSQGEIVHGLRRLSQPKRSTMLTWGLYMNNLPPFRRLTDDPWVECFEVDICKNLFLPKSGFHLETDQLLERVESISLGGETAYCLSKEDMLLDLCGHLYKEATTVAWIRQGIDLHLIKFCDIAEFVRSVSETIDWDIFLSRVKTNELVHPMYYSLHYTDILYPQVIPSFILDELRPSDLSYLDKYGFVDYREPATWKSEFLTRLFDTGRRIDIER